MKRFSFINSRCGSFVCFSWFFPIFFVFHTWNFFLQLIWLKKILTDNFLVKTMGVIEFLVWFDDIFLKIKKGWVHFTKISTAQLRRTCFKNRHPRFFNVVFRTSFWNSQMKNCRDFHTTFSRSQASDLVLHCALYITHLRRKVKKIVWFFVRNRQCCSVFSSNLLAPSKF